MNECNKGVLDVEKMTVEKNYAQEVKNDDFLKLLQSVQRVGNNLENIDKGFLSLIIDIIVNEDKKTGQTIKRNKDNQKQNIF